MQVNWNQFRWNQQSNILLWKISWLTCKTLASVSHLAKLNLEVEKLISNLNSPSSSSSSLCPFFFFLVAKLKDFFEFSLFCHCLPYLWIYFPNEKKSPFILFLLVLFLFIILKDNNLLLFLVTFRQCPDMLVGSPLAYR